jgi:8-oxo-dGTP pyrophosphatase MutT (NUDIX family)
MNKWGLIKGRVENTENNKETAIREFFEETGIKLKFKYLEKFFFQKNFYKNIGVFLYNAENIKYYTSYFKNDELKYKTNENETIKWFPLDELPLIHNNQKELVKNIKEYIDSNPTLFLKNNTEIDLYIS